jgi:hypothetical protein
MDEAKDEIIGSVISVGTHPTAYQGSIGDFHFEAMSQRWRRDLSRGNYNYPDNTEWDEDVGNFIFMNHEGDSTDGGLAIYCTDIEGTPIMADCMLPMAVRGNWYRTTTQVSKTLRDDGTREYEEEIEQGPLYDNFPYVGEFWTRTGEDANKNPIYDRVRTPADGEVLIQLPLRKSMNTAGVTEFFPELGEIRENFGSSDMWDGYPQVSDPQPSDDDSKYRASWNQNKTEGQFYIVRARTAPIGEVTIPQPIFINTNLEQAKYYLSATPPKWSDE